MTKLTMEYSEINPDEFDGATRPQDDFFQHINGRWIGENPIPPDQKRWGVDSVLHEDNMRRLKEIMEAIVTADGVESGMNRQKLRDYYLSGLDAERLNRDGSAPLLAHFEAIDGITDVSLLADVLAQLHYDGVSAMWDAGVYPDLKDSGTYAFYLEQGGMHLPTCEYYTKTSEKDVEIREKYVAHITAMFQLLGYSREDAVAAADTVLRLETELAEQARTPTELRDLERLYNPVSVDGMSEYVPAVDWVRYFEATNVPVSEHLILEVPEFFQRVQRVLTSWDIDDIKTYLRWAVLASAAPYLSDEFAEEKFAFYGTVLNGTTERKPRWYRVITHINGILGMALGEEYVARYFDEQAEARVTELVVNLITVMSERIDSLEWMSDETKVRAHEKLESFSPMLGHPDKWRDYNALTVNPVESYYETVLRTRRFEHDRLVARVGKEVDPNEWGMSPQAVNAYINFLTNRIVFPAGILQPPFFDATAENALNYGGIGAVIGHEISHGYDDMGSKFDSNGNMENWWTDEDRADFEVRTKIIVDQFNEFVAVDDIHVNGELTLGENIGDLAGVIIAYEAFLKTLDGTEEPIDGFTPQQRFFISYALSWCVHSTAEATRELVLSDPHAPGRFRVLGSLANVNAFYEAFSVQEGDGMWRPPEKRADIW